MTYRMLIVLVALTAAGPALAQTTAPATAPAGGVELLDQGRVRIAPPAGWTLRERGKDGLRLSYQLDDGRATMTIIVTPQDTVPTSETVDKVSRAMVKDLRETARNTGAQMLIPPRVEQDERFLLKLRDRIRGTDGKARDQLQVYRVMNLELVHVAVIANVETEAEAEPIFAAAEEMLLKAKIGSGPKPTAFRRTRVRMTIPPDWQEERADDPNGVVATYTNPAYPGARLVVRSKVIPRDAKTNAQVRDYTLDALVDDYRNGALPDGAGLRHAEKKVDAPPFVRYVQHSLTWNGQPWGLDFRCLVVGDVAIGVEALVPPLDQTVTRLANEMALSIRSLDDKRRAGGSARPARAPATRLLRRVGELTRGA